MALRYNRNQPQKTATLKLTGFFFCGSSNVLERQVPEYFSSIWNSNLFRMDGESRISKLGDSAANTHFIR